MRIIGKRIGARRLVLTCLAGLGTVAAALVFTSAASTGSGGNSLKLSIVANTKGPLTICTDPNDTYSGCTVRDFLYVENQNPVPVLGAPPLARDTLPGAFVMSSVDETVFVNGAVLTTFHAVPPPNIGGNLPIWSGHWPETVTCASYDGSPCNVIGSPAVDPGETALAFFGGWASGNYPGVEVDPAGTYFFRWTIHGTVDGTPVDLTADSPKIKYVN